MTKYTVLVEHEGGLGRVDKAKPLEAQDLRGALKEVTDLCKGDLADIYKVILYEQVGNSDKYKMIMKSYDGKFFCVDSSPLHLIRRAFKSNGKTVESFEWKNNY